MPCVDLAQHGKVNALKDKQVDFDVQTYTDCTRMAKWEREPYLDESRCTGRQDPFVVGSISEIPGIVWLVFHHIDASMIWVMPAAQ